MKHHPPFILPLVCFLLVGCQNPQPSPTKLREYSSSVTTNKAPYWRGIHLFVQTDEAVDGLAEEMPNLVKIGVNTIVLEVNYSFDFKSRPELRNPKGVTRERAKSLAAVARANGVRLIPELDCLGHQSTRKYDSALLRVYPQFAEPIGSNTDTNGAHLHSWCPQNPEVYKVVLPLIDELAEAFDATAFHVGMDEVFCIASDKCPRCKGGDPAKLYAKAVNDLHHHIVGERKMEMLMWGDRLLDSRKIGYGKWEASRNGTHGAVDLIPKDIIICDWHYEKRRNYPSVPFFLEKGFRVWPSGWQPLEATQAFSKFSRELNHPRVVGYLCTAWSKANAHNATTWPPFVEVLKEWKNDAH